MDFFRILAYNNARTIPETTVSSLLNYFFDPGEDHGLRYEFLGLFLDRLGLLPPDYTRSRFCRERPEVSVEPERSIEEDEGSSGSIDSCITITLSAVKLIIGIEVKIHDRSVKYTSGGRPQLQRYAKFFAQHFGPDQPETISKLLFLAPGSEGSIDWARKSLEPIDSTSDAARDAEALRNVLLVLPWTDPAVDRNACPETEPKGEKMPWLAPVSMERILSELLSEEAKGDISPADPHAIAVLRSIRNAAKGSFHFEPLSSAGPRASQQFPDERSFRQALLVNDHEDLLDCLLEVVSWYSRRVGISGHMFSSIGIPMGKKGETPGDNRLCRIHKVARYEEPNLPLSKLRIGLDAAEKFTDEKIAGLREYMASQWQGDSPPIGFKVECGEHYHPKAVKDEPIIVLDFERYGEVGPKWREDAKEWFRMFFTKLRDLAGVQNPEVLAPKDE